MSPLPTPGPPRHLPTRGVVLAALAMAWGALIPVLPAANREGYDDPLPRRRAVEAIQTRRADREVDLDSLWDRASLIDERPGHFIRSLDLTGRLHFDYVDLADEGGRYRDAEMRRSRAGFRLGLLDHWELKAEVDFDLNEADPAYLRLTDAHLRWHPNDRLSLKIGKQATFFTLEGATSSNQLLTLDRSSLSGSLWFSQSLIPGIVLEYDDGPWRHAAGIYTGGSASPEFGDFDGSAFGLWRIARDISGALDADEALLGLHYVYQDPDHLNTFTIPQQHIASLNFRYRSGHWGLQTDLIASAGSLDQPDHVGALAMPYYDLSEHWQLVARASFVTGDGEGGVRLPYHERRVSPERGESARELYLGVNRYFRGHQCKWQTGIQHTRLTGGSGYEGWGVATGIRISFW